MPPICLHLGVAGEAISRLRHPVVDNNPGSYYLGSTAPDIRFFIGVRREETHFLPLNCENGASGSELMFRAYPELIDDVNLGEATRAFIAGYLSHLVTDELWIYRIYRPFFSKSSSLEGDNTANLFDRLLQFELERRERLNGSLISSARSELLDSGPEVSVGFVDAPTLNRWREFVYIATSGELGWDDFRVFAQKYIIWMRYKPAERLESFFEAFDDRLKQVLDVVPEEQLREFREQSIESSVKLAGEYLG